MLAAADSWWPMTERTGLGPLELAILRSVSATAGTSGTHARTTTVLGYLDEVERIGPAYGQTVLQDLGSWWRVHLRLFDLEGNWGDVAGGAMADARYTEVGLSQLGELALASEEGEVGPVPIGLVDGSLYRGGQQPPLDPARALGAVSKLLEDDTLLDGDLQRLVGLPSLPTGGRVRGDIEGLYAGRLARLLQSCLITREQLQGREALVITTTPLGVATDQITRSLWDSARVGQEAAPVHYLPDQVPPRTTDAAVSPTDVVDVREELSGGRGTRIVVLARRGADLDALERWVRRVWPVTIETSCRFQGGIASVLRTWASACQSDRSGLDRLRGLMS